MIVRVIVARDDCSQSLSTTVLLIQDYTHPGDHIPPTYEMTPGLVQLLSKKLPVNHTQQTDNMIRKLKEKGLNFPPHVVLEVKNVTIDWDKKLLQCEEEEDNVSNLRWLDPVFLQVHLPSLNLLYLTELIFIGKNIITHVLHKD